MRDRVESHAHWFLEISHGIARFVMMKHVMHSGLDDIGHQFEGGIMHIIFAKQLAEGRAGSVMRSQFDARTRKRHGTFRNVAGVAQIGRASCRERVWKYV